MQLINQKMGVSVQQILIAKHHLMTNNIVIYYGNKLSSFGLKVGVTHKHWSCNEIKGSIGCWINKTIFAQYPYIVCYVFIMKLQRMVLLFRVYSTFKLLKYSKVCPALFLIMHASGLIFSYLKNILNLLRKVVQPKPDQLDWFRRPCLYVSNLMCLALWT